MALRRRSLVPSTARSLFGETKRECGVGTVGSEIEHLLTGCGETFVSLNARFSRHEYLLYALILALGPCRGRYFPAMESTQRYGRRGVSNPPSCTSPQRLLRRRRARYAVHFRETFLNRTALGSSPLFFSKLNLSIIKNNGFLFFIPIIELLCFQISHKEIFNRAGKLNDIRTSRF